MGPRRRRFSGMQLYRLSWLLWIAGTVIIVLSWCDAVSATVGWYGFAVALAGTLLSWAARSTSRDSLSPATRAYIEEHIDELRGKVTAVTPSQAPPPEGETGTPEPPREQP